MATKTTTKTAAKTSADKKTVKPRGKYIFAIARRKSATVMVKMFMKGSGKVTVNDRDMNDYFTTLDQKQAVLAPLEQFSLEKKVDIEAKATGGGLSGQSQAIRSAVARALVKHDPDNKPTLREHGFMTIDARKKERKKPGLKGARRAPQWRKR